MNLNQILTSIFPLSKYIHNNDPVSRNIKAKDYGKILRDYYQLTIQETLTDADCDQLETILELAESDSLLSLMIYEVDQLIYEQLELVNCDSQQEDCTNLILALNNEQIEQLNPYPQPSHLADKDKYENILSNYYKLINLPYLSDEKIDELEQILTKAETDSSLAFFLYEIDQEASKEEVSKVSISETLSNLVRCLINKRLGQFGIVFWIVFFSIFVLAKSIFSDDYLGLKQARLNFRLSLFICSSNINYQKKGGFNKLNQDNYNSLTDYSDLFPSPNDLASDVVNNLPLCDSSSDIAKNLIVDDDVFTIASAPFESQNIGLSYPLNKHEKSRLYTFDLLSDNRIENEYLLEDDFLISFPSPAFSINSELHKPETLLTSDFLLSSEIKDLSLLLNLDYTALVATDFAVGEVFQFSSEPLYSISMFTDGKSYSLSLDVVKAVDEPSSRFGLILLGLIGLLIRRPKRSCIARGKK